MQQGTECTTALTCKCRNVSKVGAVRASKLSALLFLLQEITSYKLTCYPLALLLLLITALGERATGYY